MSKKYREAYFPGTEELGPDEMRLTALGTGMPILRPSQASAAWLLELGNGDKFFFDMGTGSMTRFASLGIPYAEANRLFTSHLHSDHIGDFIPWYIGGWIERGPECGVEVWGPSGPEAKLGTKYGLEHLVEGMTWDITSRTGRLPDEGRELAVNEFDYRGLNDVIYERNNVTVRSFPVPHAIDGAVAYGVEWNGLKFVYGGDCGPNKYFMEYAQGADIAIHECFVTVEILMEKLGFPKDLAVNIGTRDHTSPAAWASVMKEVQPRLGIAYHFFSDAATNPSIFKEIINVYEGPVSLAKDLMVWNITQQDIAVRQVINTPDTYPMSRAQGKPGTRGAVYPMSDWLKDSKVTFPGIDEYPDVEQFE